MFKINRKKIFIVFVTCLILISSSYGKNINKKIKLHEKLKYGLECIPENASAVFGIDINQISKIKNLKNNKFIRRLIDHLRIFGLKVDKNIHGFYGWITYLEPGNFKYCGVTIGDFNISQIMNKIRRDKNWTVVNRKYRGTLYYVITYKKRDEYTFSFYNSKMMLFGDEKNIHKAFDVIQGSKWSIVNNKKMYKRITASAKKNIFYTIIKDNFYKIIGFELPLISIPKGIKECDINVFKNSKTIDVDVIVKCKDKKSVNEVIGLIAKVKLLLPFINVLFSRYKSLTTIINRVKSKKDKNVVTLSSDLVKL